MHQWKTKCYSILVASKLSKIFVLGRCCARGALAWQANLAPPDLKIYAPHPIYWLFMALILRSGRLSIHKLVLWISCPELSCGFLDCIPTTELSFGLVE